MFLDLVAYFWRSSNGFVLPRMFWHFSNLAYFHFWVLDNIILALMKETQTSFRKYFALETQPWALQANLPLWAPRYMRNPYKQMTLGLIPVSVTGMLQALNLGSSL